MHHRYYSPRLGHFLTPDFRAPDIYDPSTFTEPYAYAAGNPVMFWDPNGLEVFLQRNQDTTHIMNILRAAFGGGVIFDENDPSGLIRVSLNSQGVPIEPHLFGLIKLFSLDPNNARVRAAAILAGNIDKYQWQGQADDLKLILDAIDDRSLNALVYLNGSEFSVARGQAPRGAHNPLGTEMFFGPGLDNPPAIISSGRNAAYSRFYGSDGREFTANLFNITAQSLVEVGADEVAGIAFAKLLGLTGRFIDDLGRMKLEFQPGGVMVDSMGNRHVTFPNVSFSMGSGSSRMLDKVRRIAQKHKLFQCIECADAIQKTLLREGISGEVITLRYQSKGFIVSDIYGANTAISKNGVHRGILIDGMVFDNIHQSGIPLQKWLNDFHGIGPRAVERNPF